MNLLCNCILVLLVILYFYIYRYTIRKLAILIHILFLRLCVKKTFTKVLQYEPDKWIKSNILISNRNCYLYALDINVKFPIKKEYISLFGTLSGTYKENMTDLESFESCFAELSILNLNYCECKLETPIPKGYHKIAIYYTTDDIHWLRQDFDGAWSHKIGWHQEPTNKDVYGSKILNPETAYLDVVGEFLEMKYLLIWQKTR